MNSDANNANCKGKKLLLLGGVRQGCEIIEEAKRMGVETFVTDNRSDSPAKAVADHSFMVDATDVDAVVQLCKQQEIDGVITGYVDMLLPYCQQICEKLGVPFWGNAANIAMCTDKELFKIACEKAEVPTVPWCKATTGDYLSVLERIEVPVVIKPVDNSGSRGVVKCRQKSQLRTCVEKSLAFSPSGTVLIEKAMDPNEEFSTYYMMNHGHYYMTLMGDRYVKILNPDIAPIGEGMTYPSIHLKEWMDDVHPRVCRFFDENEMKNGFAFLQGFYDKEQNRLCVHEIGYRAVGGFSFKYVEHFSGYSRIRELIRFSLTGSMDERELRKTDPFFKGFGMTVTISLKPGVIGSVEGTEDLRKKEGIIHLRELHKVGDEITTGMQGTLAQVFAYVLCTASNRGEMERIVDTIGKTVRIRDADGNDMANALLDCSKIKF